MNYEIVAIIISSYLLGIFTMWIRNRCSVKKDETPMCHFHPQNQTDAS